MELFSLTSWSTLTHLFPKSCPHLSQQHTRGIQLICAIWSTVFRYISSCFFHSPSLSVSLISLCLFCHCSFLISFFRPVFRLCDATKPKSFHCYAHKNSFHEYLLHFFTSFVWFYSWLVWELVFFVLVAVQCINIVVNHMTDISFFWYVNEQNHQTLKAKKCFFLLTCTERKREKLL